jgi:predicted dehydrogenase
VGSGIIGDPRLYYLNDLHYTPPDGMYSVTPWRQRSDHSGGYILDGGSHIVAGLRVMVDATPTEVHAVPTSFHPGHLGAPWDTALVNLRFDNGIVGHLALGYGSPDREARHPKILGTEGTIALKKDRIEIWRSDATKDETLELVGRSSGIPDEWDDFVPALRRNSALKYPALEAVRDLAVIDGILASARSGAVVPVERY